MNVRRAALLMLLPLLATCCGGSGSSSSTGSATSGAPRLTQKQFVSAGNKVCVDADRRVFRIGSLSADPSGWDRTAKAARRGIADMEKVRPPAKQQARFDLMLASARRLEASIAQVRDALRKQNLEQARAAQTRATKTDTKIKRQASALGLTFCEQLLTNWPA